MDGAAAPFVSHAALEACEHQSGDVDGGQVQVGHTEVAQIASITVVSVHPDRRNRQLIGASEVGAVKITGGDQHIDIALRGDLAQCAAAEIRPSI